MKYGETRDPHTPADQISLRTIPNIGPAMASDLQRLGITNIDSLAECDADDLYAAIGRLDGVTPDPCVHDVFAAAIDFARGFPARPWWEYSRERKARAGRPVRR